RRASGRNPGVDARPLTGLVPPEIGLERLLDPARKRGIGANEDMDPALRIGALGLLVHNAAVLRDAPGHDAGSGGRNVFGPALAYRRPGIVFPGAAIVVAVGVQEIVIADHVRGLAPAPGYVQAAFGSIIQAIDVGVVAHAVEIAGIGAELAPLARGPVV